MKRLTFAPDIQHYQRDNKRQTIQNKDSMKKIFMTLAAAIIAVSASAQVYVGGNIGIASTKIEGGDSKTAYRVLPEIGYNIDKDWAIGASFGWAKGNPVSIENPNNFRGTFEINPYVRYTFLKSQHISVFMDGGFGYKHYNGWGDEWNVGLKPGVAANFGKFSFVAHVGFAGYRTEKADWDGAKSSNAWGVSLDGNNVSFGVYYNF